MEMTMIGWLHQLGTLEFWEALLEGFGGLGPIAPVILAMVESFFPPLPLIAIVALNVAAHGGLLGFVYSWAGVMLGGTVTFLLWRRVVKRFFWKFARRSAKLQKAEQCQQVRHRVPVHAVAPALYALVLYALCLWHL